MIDRVRIMMPVYNLTDHPLSLASEIDTEQGVIVLKALNPTTQNLVEPRQYAILSYTSTARPAIQFKVRLFLDDTLQHKDFGLCAFQKPDLEATTVALIQDNHALFMFPHDLGVLVLAEKCKNREEVGFQVSIAENLLKGEIVCPETKPNKEA